MMDSTGIALDQVAKVTVDSTKIASNQVAEVTMDSTEIESDQVAKMDSTETESDQVAKMDSTEIESDQVAKMDSTEIESDQVAKLDSTEIESDQVAKVDSTEIVSNQVVNVTVDSTEIALDQVVEAMMDSIKIASDQVAKVLMDSIEIASDQVAKVLMDSIEIASDQVAKVLMDSTEIASDQVAKVSMDSTEIASDQVAKVSMDSTKIASDQVAKVTMDSTEIASDHIAEAMMDSIEVASNQVAEFTMDSTEIAPDHVAEAMMDSIEIASDQVAEVVMLDPIEIAPDQVVESIEDGIIIEFAPDPESDQQETDTDPASDSESDQQETDTDSAADSESDQQETDTDPAVDSESDEQEMDTDPASEESDQEKNIKIRSDTDLRTKIWSSLKKLETPTAFAYSAVSSALPIPGLNIPPHGLVRFPLLTDDVQKIISEARQSPFGKGEETIIDTTFRKSWELNPNQFSLENPDWNETIEQIKNTVCMELGLKNGARGVSAELHKLLLYEEGAFFKAHKDSEKAPGMFGTLVVSLPSPHEGGKLVMRHDDETYEFETAESSSFRFSYAAWYADITHEVLPVTSGYRLVLVYNLIRKPKFEMPNYEVISGRLKRLSTLLERYKSKLESENNKFPPILLHGLKHKYTQANLQLNLLKPHDLAQAQNLIQVSTKLGFDVYLATSELTVNADDDYEDFKEREWCLKNLVKLDGELIAKGCKYPKGALIDPVPQEDREPDEEKHEGPTGNEGSPAKYWYRDTVVVLVPPSKQLEFIFQFNSGWKTIEPLFNERMQEFAGDPAQKPKLERLCELAVTQEIHWHYQGIPSYFQQATTTVLDLGRLDLFNKACETTNNKILLENACMVGRYVAKYGVPAMSDQLMKGIKAASTVAGKIEFLKSITEGFQAEELDLNARATLKQWSDEAILLAVNELDSLTKDDAVSVAHLGRSVDWSLFASKALPIVLKADAMIKMIFIHELKSILPQVLTKKQQSFFEIIILDFWNKFDFNIKLKSQGSDGYSFSWRKKEDIIYLTRDDLLRTIDISVTILSSDCVETNIIPAMLASIPTASKECTNKFFIMLVRKILKNELVGFERLTDDAVPPPSHKRLIQAFLMHYLKENVELEPQAPTNWSLPASKCKCKDCLVINRFLQNPVQKTLDYRCYEAQRKHLHKTFSNSNCDRQGPTYDVETVRSKGTPYIWRITKNRRGFEEAKSNWLKNTVSALKILTELKNDEPVVGRLEAYLKPYFSVIMSAKIKELPDLKSFVATVHVSESNENTVPNHFIDGFKIKREVDETDPVEIGLAKRIKSEIDY